jgi:hypothetical protein
MALGWKQESAWQQADELKEPEGLVVSLMSCTAEFVIATVAPLKTAPEGSITVPTILPVPTV